MPVQYVGVGLAVEAMSIGAPGPGTLSTRRLGQVNAAGRPYAAAGCPLLDKSGHIAQRAFMITRALPHNGGIIRTPNIFYKICACAAQWSLRHQPSSSVANC